MAIEVTSLSLNVKSDSVAKGSSRLDKLSRSSKQADRSQQKLTKATARNAVAMGKNAGTTGASSTATKGHAVASAGAATATKGLTVATGGLGVALKSTLGPLLAMLAPLLAIKKAFSATVELQDFQAQLKTATGSVENAAVAFEALEGFASETPYQLEQSLEAFIKLTNLGLTPSEKALKSYGNTASAMGKDLTQLIEAVADATTGEFERLKEFGIKSKSQGDLVSFTFRGVTKTVKKEAAAIEGYLMALGENEFAGAMSDRMATVGGQVSNLGDLWNQLFRTISEMGVGNLIGATVQIAINALDGLISMLKSGQLEAELDSWGVAFEGWAKDFETTLDFVGELFGVAAQDWVDTSGDGFSGILDLFKLLPALIRKVVQRIGIEIWAIASYGVAVGEAMIKSMVESFKLIIQVAKVSGKAIGQALNPFNDVDFKEALKKGAQEVFDKFAEVGKKQQGIFKGVEEQISITRKVRKEMIGEIESDFTRSVEQVDSLTKKAKELRLEYDKERAARKKARTDGTATDALAQFKIKPTATTTSTSGVTATGAVNKELERLINDLLTEEELIEKSYQKRLDIIRKNTAAGSELRTNLEVKATKDRNEQLKALEQKRYNTAFSMADEYFSNFTGLAESNNKDLARIGQAALAVQKGIAIAQTTMKTYEGATAAYSSMAGVPYVGPALGAAAAAAVVAAGLARVASISSTNTNVGNYASGGIVPGSSFTGDNLTAGVNSGEMILNTSQQSRLLSMADGTLGTSGGTANVTIINQTKTPVEAEARTDESGNYEIVIREAVSRTKQELTNEANVGGGDFVPALSQNFGLTRAGQ